MAKFFKCTAVLLVIIVVFGAAMFALNLHTGPIIEENTLGAANDRLNLVMDGRAYEDITATLKDVPASVVKVNKEIDGLGYVIEATATSKYTGGEPMDILIGVSADGKICGIKLVSHSESLIFGEDYPSTYIGKDSALSGVELFAGSTFSSTAFKTAVEESLGLLIANDLIKAGVKTPDQILTEMLPTVAPDFASAQKSEGKGDVLTVFKAQGGSAYIIVSGEEYFLAVIGADGTCKVFDVTSADVTASKADIVTKAEEYAAFAANERINQMLEGASGFEEISATLKDVPASVVKVHKETSGLGFVIEAQATSQYTGSIPMDILIGVSADGKITNIKLAAHSESLIFGEDYPSTYIGKDSALAGVDIYAGSTYSSTAFKTAVEEALGVLISNNLITAGVKSDEQILTEMIPTVAPGYVKTAEVNVSGNITKAFKAGNDAGFAYIVKNGDANLLAVVNAMGVCKVYNTAGEDVTASNEAVVTEATAHASANQKAFQTAADTKFGNMVEGATEFTPIALDTFNSVVYAAQFKVEDAIYYGFYSRSFGFDQMDVYIVIDENGAIVKMDATQFIFHEEYFGAFAGMPGGYKDGFVGVTEETFGEQYIIATATMTSNAVKQSTEDAFSSFNTLKDGGNA